MRSVQHELRFEHRYLCTNISNTRVSILFHEILRFTRRMDRDGPNRHTLRSIYDIMVWNEGQPGYRMDGWEILIGSKAFAGTLNITEGFRRQPLPVSHTRNETSTSLHY